LDVNLRTSFDTCDMIDTIHLLGLALRAAAVGGTDIRLPPPVDGDSSARARSVGEADLHALASREITPADG
jgi:hypothetical protein